MSTGVGVFFLVAVLAFGAISVDVLSLLPQVVRSQSEDAARPTGAQCTVDKESASKPAGESCARADGHTTYGML